MTDKASSNDGRMPAVAQDTAQRPDFGEDGGLIERQTPHRRQSAPPKVINAVIDKLDLFEWVDLLVSSPGRVDVAERARKVCPRAVITCVEPNVTLRQMLTLEGYDLMGDAEGDFLEVHCWPGFDRIVSIPPPACEEDIEHLRHAFRMLKPGGRLVAVMTKGALHKPMGRLSQVSHPTDYEATSLRDWLDEVGGKIEDLPGGTSSEDVGPDMSRACMVVITKPEESTDVTTAAAAEVEVIPVTAAGA